jgi:hypothetical protein
VDDWDSDVPLYSTRKKLELVSKSWDIASNLDVTEKG